MDRIIIIKHPESSYSGNRITRTSGASLVRKEKYELPPEAIREMIINAHGHRNLLDESCIQVAVYEDRLEVTSPGGLYNGLIYEEVMNGHSKIRNKGIANIFTQMGLVEAWGSGIKSQATTNLKELLDKRDAIRKEEILSAVVKSGRSYEDIL